MPAGQGRSALFRRSSRPRTGRDPQSGARSAGQGVGPEGEGFAVDDEVAAAGQGDDEDIHFVVAVLGDPLAGAELHRQPGDRNRYDRRGMRALDRLLLLFSVACDTDSDDREQVLGAVEQRGGLRAAVSAGMDGIPVAQEVAPAVIETSSAKVFRLLAAVTLDDAVRWFASVLSEGQAVDGWAGCGRRQG